MRLEKNCLPVRERIAAFRATARFPPQSTRNTFAPWARAIESVSSVDPVSTTIISSTSSEMLSRASETTSFSSRTIMHMLTHRPIRRGQLRFREGRASRRRHLRRCFAFTAMDRTMEAPSLASVPDMGINRCATGAPVDLSPVTNLVEPWPGKPCREGRQNVSIIPPDTPVMFKREAPKIAS